VNAFSEFRRRQARRGEGGAVQEGLRRLQPQMWGWRFHHIWLSSRLDPLLTLQPSSASGDRGAA